MDRLIEAAARARQHACALYSGFRVGAALEDAEGRVWTGCNIENATYGLTVCAERVALLKALSEGARRFRRLAVVTAANTLTPPCGACRQLLWEYAGDLEIVLADTQGGRETLRLSQLLPRPFDASYLGR
ncbi:MAG: cytidine deaminase [Bryobacteraceae bacterium]